MEYSPNTENILRAEYPEDFIQTLSLTHKLLEPCEINDVQFGPIYSIETSSGQPITVVAIKPSYDTSQRPHVEEVWTLYALNENDEIVGIRITELLKPNLPHQIIAGRESSGKIAVGPRGHGIATTIELCFFDLLERLATHYFCDIYERGENDIIKDLINLEKQSEQTSETSDISRAIENKRAEYKRWEHLYGNNGILGFVNLIKRIRQPQKSYSSIDDWGFISLKRYTERGINNQTHAKSMPLIAINSTDQFHHESVSAERESYFRIIKETVAQLNYSVPSS